MPDEVKPAAADATPEPPDDFNDYESYRNAGDKLEEETPAAAAEKPVAETAPASDPDDTEEQEEPAALNEDAKPDDDKPKKVGGFQKKIDKLSREKGDLERRVRELEGRTAEPAVTPAEKAPAKVEGKPTPDDFDTYDEFTEALTEYKLNERDQKQAAAVKQRESAEAERAINERWNAARAEHEDFNETLEAIDDIVFPAHTRDAIALAEDGPTLAYELAKNRPEAERIAKIADPVKALFELGKFAAKLDKPAKAEPAPPKPKAAITSAPKPVTPLRGGTAGGVKQDVYDEEKAADYNEWEKARRAQLKAG